MASSFENVNDCLICLTESVDVIEIIEKTAGKQDNIGTIISKYFWFEATDYENRKLCTTCWKKIYDFHTFYLEIESLHERDVWQTHQPIVEINMGEIVEPSTVKTEEIKDEFDFDMTHVNIKTECSDELEADKQVNKADKANESEQSDESDSETSEEEQEEEDSVDSDDSDQPLIKRKKSSPKKTTKKSTKKEKEDDLIRKVCPLECDKCKKKFKTFQSLYSHYEKEHDCKGYAMCCTKKFCKKNELLDHVERHENPSKFKCQQCSKVLVSSKSLQSHIKAMHNDEKPYKCEECPKSFIRKSLLDRHKGVHVPVDKREFTCEYCAKNFGNKQLLSSHIRVHEGTQSGEDGETESENEADLKKTQADIEKEDQLIRDNCKVVCDICAAPFKTMFTMLCHSKDVHKTSGYLWCCGKKFFKKYILLDHFEVHTNPKKYHCEECNKTYNSGSNLKQHNRIIHASIEEKKWECNDCDKRFVKEGLLKSHMRVHKKAKGRDIICQICYKGFTKISRLHQHERAIHAERDPSAPAKKNKTPDELEAEDKLIKEFCNLVCELCGHDCETLLEIQKHFKEKHDKTGYITCCNKRFFKRVRLVEHIQFHSNPNMFRCNLCNKNYTDTEALQNHIANQHTPDEDKPYKCDQCPKTFMKEYQLVTHYGYHVPESEHAFKCEPCSKTFGSQVFLDRHNRTHHGPKHICDICAREFKRISEFKVHMLKHDDNYKPDRHQCPHCLTWLKDIKHFRKHVRHHLDQNEYFCDICGQKAPHKIALQNHKRRVHFTERTHKCTLCDKAFKTKLNLKEHTATHTGEALYTCSYCPRTFISNANMASHRKKMHPKEWMENNLRKKMDIELGLEPITRIGRPPIN